MSLRYYCSGKVENHPEPPEYFDRPRTDPPKRGSAQNAIKHGLFAEHPVMPGEKKEDFEAFLKDLNLEHLPFGPTEESLVLSIADTEWRRRRISKLENDSLERSLTTGEDPVKAMNLWGLYSSRMNRELQSTIKTLKLLQEKRMAEDGRHFRMAVVLWEYHKSKGVDWNPQEDGFVFSQEWLDKQLTLNDYLAAALESPRVRATTKEMDQLLWKKAAYHSQYSK